MTENADRAGSVVDALGTAWTIYGLYPDPEQQDAFVRSLDAARSSVSGSLSLEVGAGLFLVDGQEVELEREGVDRLARQCYLHQIEVIRITPELKSSDLVKFFGVLNEDEKPVRAAGGVDAMLKRDGVTGIPAVQKPLLKPTPTFIERQPDVQHVMDQTDPASFAAELVADAAEGAPLAEAFFERYRDVLSQVDEDDTAGREEIVRAFVEAFFHFDEGQQVDVFSHLLPYRDDPDVRMFVDQFAGHELARMAPRLDQAALAMLMEYAQVATDQADGRPEELIDLLQSPDAMETARSTVAAKVQQRMGDVAEAVDAVGSSFDSIRSQMPESRHLFFDALSMFRAVLHVEDREQRFHRLMRIWSGKIAAAVRKGEYRRAELWLHAATDNPTYPRERRQEVQSALSQLAGSDMSRTLVEAAIEEGSDVPFRLLLMLGPAAIDVLVDMLATEQDAARRRVMLAGLSEAAARDPDPIVRRLSDAPWYLARNLAAPLGRSGHPEVAGPLVELADHEDYRVRLEAVRSLVTLLGDDALPYLTKALSDESGVVREAAASLLAGRNTPEAQAALIDALEGGLDAGEKERIVGLLGDDLTPEAAAALETLASQRLVLSSSRRSLRAAAQAALGRT